jgi:sugar phosphate isomerase/epimerase
MKFGSRLNSMKDRLDLWDGPNDVFGWVARQGTIKGLDLVDFNYPQHLENVPVADAREALFKAGLKAGALCMRYPKKFQAGAFTNPNPVLRQEAIELTKEAGQWARDLGAEELVVWSAFDGYDYNNQVDYLEKWRQVVNAFQEVCDAYPDIKVSLEFKATDENTRFFIVPSTGAALQLVEDINRPNMGLTLDVGHCLMAGENPAQSCAMVGSKGKLFGIQLNDGTTRLAAEDGLMFGSVHPLMALEFVRWLQKTNFKGHVYFDTFPRNEDPVREAEFNIRRFKAMWKRASRLSEHGVDDLLANHDAMRVLELLEEIGEI